MGLDGRAASCFDQVTTPWANETMWTPATRRQHSRAGLRYASDLADDEWRVLEPLLPCAPRLALVCPAARPPPRQGFQGHLRLTALRACLQFANAFLYAASVIIPAPNRSFRVRFETDSEAKRPGSDPGLPG